MWKISWWAHTFCRFRTFLQQVSMVTPAAPAHPLRAFCDGCGSRFEEGQLRPLSKFCSYCGEPLSPWILRQIASPATRSFTTAHPSRAPTTLAQQDRSVSPEDESPVRPAGVRAARQNGPRRLFHESASDDEDDDLPVIPAQRNRRGRISHRPVTPAQPELPSSRAKRSAERINYSVDNAFYQMSRPSSNQVQSERSQKRLKTERPLTRSTAPQVRTLSEIPKLKSKIKSRKNSSSSDLSGVSPKALFDSNSEDDDDEYDTSDDLEDELGRPLGSYRKRAFARRSKPFIHPPFVHSDRPISDVRTFLQLNLILRRVTNSEFKISARRKMFLPVLSAIKLPSKHLIWVHRSLLAKNVGRLSGTLARSRHHAC